MRGRVRETSGEGGRESSGQFEYNTSADLIGTGEKKIEKERERGEGKVGTAFARVSESAKCKQKRREKERNKDQERIKPSSNRVHVAGQKRQTGKEETKYRRRRRRRDKRKKKKRRRRPGTRMQIDAVTHDATARKSHTKSRRG